MKHAVNHPVTEKPADKGFILKHPLDDKEQAIYVRHQERIAYARLEYQQRLNELNGWYGHQKCGIYDNLVSELEAINR